MGLLGDFEEISRHWKKLTTPMRIIVGISFSISVLSIGSLADNVFHFKGFLIEAISYYRSLVSPVRSLLVELFQIDDPQFVIDLAVSINLLAFAETQALLAVKPFDKVDYTKSSLRVTLLLINWFVTCVLAAIFWWLTNPRVTTALFVIVLPIIYFFRSIFMLRAFHGPNRLQYQQELVATLYMFSIYLGVGTLAAVSEGFHRPF